MKWFVFFLSVLGTFTSSNTMADFDECEIVRITDYKYYAMKRLPTPNRDEGKNQNIRMDEVFFVFERAGNGVGYWDKYIKEQKEYSDILGRGDKGILGFEKSLALSARHDDYATWVIYATLKDPRSSKIEPCKDIEMACTLLVNEHSLITTHIGISRTAAYFFPHKKHSNLSTQLHGFGAAVSKIAYPQVEYMMTKPLYTMRDIMINNLQIGEQIWVGSAKNRVQEKDLPSNFEYLESFANRRADLTLEELDTFSVLTLTKKETIKDNFEKERKFHDCIIKYLQEHTVNELKKTLESTVRVAINFGLPYNDIPHYMHKKSEEKDDNLRDKINNICTTQQTVDSEEILKEKIIDAAHTHLNEFLYYSIKKSLDDEKSTIQNFQCQRRKTPETADSIFLPDDLSIMPPVDDRNEKTWEATLHNGQKQSFNRPPWFGVWDNSQKDFMGGNHHLLISLSTVITSIPALSEIWFKKS